MTLKFRISLFISLLFTILFGVASAFIIIIYSNFRKEEFKERLEEKAQTTIKLLIDVKEVDNQMLKIIDQNSINQLYDEKTLVFNSKYELIYSSLDDTKIKWTKSDLDYLKKHKTFFKKDGTNEIYGVFYDGNRDFFALISANDSYGKRKLEFLAYLLFGAYIFFTAAAWLLTFYVVKKQILALDDFHKNISSINEHNLESRLQIKDNSKHEIDLIGKEFNFMMNRIEEAYRKQKEFTAQASHELRTPLARMSAQLENLQLKTDHKETQLIENITQNITQLNDLINSLLLLSKADAKNSGTQETARIDEAIYNSIEHVHHQFPDFKVALEISSSEEMEQLLEQHCNQGLLEIAFSNLLKNAYLYSDNGQAKIEMQPHAERLQISIQNSGPTLSTHEQEKMFEPFTRGENAKNQSGFGLGLRIVHRILSVYDVRIEYIGQSDNNIFVIEF